MILLIYVTFINRVSKSQKIFFIGLVFSAIGDFILDFDRANGFVFGLGAFLIAHLFYLTSLWPIAKEKIFFVLGYLIYGGIILSLIIPGLGKLLVPVVIYMSVLLLMGGVTLLSTKSNCWLILGGLFFVISDSIIGIDKFYYSLPSSHFVIMVTYYFAQFSLVKGMFGDGAKLSTFSTELNLSKQPLSHVLKNRKSDIN